MAHIHITTDICVHRHGHILHVHKQSDIDAFTNIGTINIGKKITM